MALRELADQIVRLHQWEHRTAVLTFPSFMVVQPAFFVALAESIGSTTSLPIRMFWLRPDSRDWSLLCHWWALWIARRHNRALSSLKPRHQIVADMRISLTVPRIDMHRDRFILVWTHQGKSLPDWATEIRLGDCPRVQRPLSQSVSA